MRAKSHRRLGEHLAQQYLHHAPRRYIHAFLIGCTEPDKNPATYLKGSLRSRWLRGHNWSNSQRFMQRLALRLEQRQRLKILDFYAMGKLIHYTMDAFTQAHNDCFTTDLHIHRRYERRLERYFLTCLENTRQCCPRIHDSVMDAIRACHQEYSQAPAGISTDTRYCIRAASLVVSMLTHKGQQDSVSGHAPEYAL